MLRPLMIGLLLPLAACVPSQPPVQSASAAPQLFRGAGQEVRLRCGSERLRARLRQGQVLAQLSEGERRVLVPVDDPRAQPGQAYSDGQLTLYKAPDSQAWALAGQSSGAAQCSHDPAGN
jgi:hypothetical protein